MKNKIFAVIVIALMLALQTNFGLVLAVGPEDQVGPRTETGPSDVVGPTSDIGPQGPTGPQTTTGPISQSNSGTGPNSENLNNATKNSEANIESTNDSDIQNNSQLDLNTGKNTVGNNSVIGDVTTGDIDGSVSVLNITGSNVSGTVGTEVVNSPANNSLTLDSIASRSQISNLLTGPGSVNLNESSNNNTVRVIDENNANLNNNLAIHANTGENQIENNTRAENITTGDINLATNIINLIGLPDSLILALDVWSIIGNLTGDLILPNAATGPGSENLNKNSTNNDASIDISGENNIANQIEIDANTGNNSFSSNTALGNISTGSTNIDNNITNLIQPVYYLINVFGKWDGSLSGLDPNSVIVNEINQTTGPDSTNVNSAETDKDIAITEEANNNVANKIRIKANTGSNSIKNNSVVGNVSTGMVNIASNIFNVANAIGSGLSNLKLGIINIFGDWTGNATREKQSGVASDLVNKKVPIIQQKTDNVENQQTNNTRQTLLRRSFTRKFQLEQIDGDIESISSSITSLNDVKQITTSDSETPIANNQDKDKNPLTIPVAATALGFLSFWGGVEYLAYRKKD